MGAPVGGALCPSREVWQARVDEAQQVGPASDRRAVLSYPDVRAAVSWLSAAFGFVERTRIGDSHRAQMSIGADGAMIVAERRDGKPAHDGGVTHLIRVRVEDVGAQFERACAHGARVLEAPTDREYGERDCTVQDVAGHRWQFAETVRDVAPEDFGCTTVAPWPGRPGA